MKKVELIDQLKKAQKILLSCIGELKNKDEFFKPSSKKTEGGITSEIKFNLTERNFVKTYVKGMSGSKKFTLLLAYLAKGKINSDTELGIISTKWDKMKSKDLLGVPFNRKYPTEAKTAGWVDSVKKGTYRLCSSWMEIFS
jgi:hypothetical protein